MPRLKIRKQVFDNDVLVVEYADCENVLSKPFVEAVKLAGAISYKELNGNTVVLETYWSGGALFTEIAIGTLFRAMALEDHMFLKTGVSTAYNVSQGKYTTGWGNADVEVLVRVDPPSDREVFRTRKLKLIKTHRALVQNIVDTLERIGRPRAASLIRDEYASIAYIRDLVENDYGLKNS